MSNALGSVRWAAGDHHGLLWSHGAALVDPTLPVEVVNDLYDRLAEVRDLGEFLTGLAEVTGAGLLGLPDFAVAVTAEGGGVQLAARGAPVAVASRGTEVLRVLGSGVRTWNERQVPAATGVVLLGGHAAEPGEDTVLRRLASGVVPAACLVAGEPLPVQPAPALAEPEVDADPGPAPDAEPEPQPETEAETRAEPEPEPNLGTQAPEAAGEFDDLLSDHTVAGSVEAAAIRPPGTEPVVVASPADADVQPSSPKDATWLEDDPDDPEDLDAGGPLSAPAAPSPALAVPLPESLGFISSVPGRPAPPPPASPPPASPSPSPTLSVAGTPSVETLGDHDGETVLQLPDAASPSVSAPAPGALGGQVLGVLCPAQHANPPHRPACRICQQPLTAPPQRLPRPSLGRVICSTGETLELSGPVVIGRAPRAARFQGTEVPRLLPLPHPHISANHVALRIEDWNLLAVDLGSTNGTFLRRNNEPPFRLPERPYLLVPGDIVDLGHGVQLRFEELP